MMDFKRIFRHLLATHSQVRRAFPPHTLDAIEQEIRASESRHVGEIRFAVEYALSGSPLYRGLTSRERAIDVFSQLRMWDTENRNGVLIYLLMADRSVEIVADRGVHVKTSSADWEQICRDMEAALREGKYEAGVIHGIRAVTALLTHHFSAGLADANRLPDDVIVL